MLEGVFDWSMFRIIIPDAVDPPFFPNAVGDLEDIILEVGEFRIETLHDIF